MQITLDDLTGLAIAQLLADHVAEMQSVTPPGSKHALDLDGLRKPGIVVWTAMEGDVAVACGAIQGLSARHAELKSMRTSPAYRARGIGSTMLTHILGQAHDMGYTRVSLETGSFDFFEPARRLYLKHGFQFCGPFNGYQDDPNSVFMTRAV